LWELSARGRFFVSPHPEDGLLTSESAKINKNLPRPVQKDIDQKEQNEFGKKTCHQVEQANMASGFSQVTSGRWLRFSPPPLSHPWKARLDKPFTRKGS
jgi:hypothetical protein